MEVEEKQHSEEVECLPEGRSAVGLLPSKLPH